MFAGLFFWSGFIARGRDGGLLGVFFVTVWLGKFGLLDGVCLLGLLGLLGQVCRAGLLGQGFLVRFLGSGLVGLVSKGSTFRLKIWIKCLRLSDGLRE